MSPMIHHIPEHLIRAYAVGGLPQGFSLVVAAHISVCDECRARLETEEMAGGAILEALAPDTATDGRDTALLAAVMAELDDPAPAEPVFVRSGIFPAPVMQALDGRPPRWRPLGAGIRQTILNSDREGSVRLLFIPPGEAVPDHSHNGLELTMVLQGSFHDETGAFNVGDVEVADGTLEHSPVAGTGAPCICLAATDAPLRFRRFLPRLLQPVFRI
ncbi:ChrR family anti-sigma-E factor [Tropicimonas sp. IMCC34043]|uniref:ChrR family anti-sigma-E factor n=1 Tax=Tropicimonas sp. IMCC34043 TaxID=2248760 RepID=UPI000E22F85B|nr:ChrR family anti-sigma-E factor [Tropicimonas sp. IMCC34043]